MTKQEKMTFCTLFDSNYIDKGLALYCSMKKHIDYFRLYIFAFDSQCFKIISDMQLKNVIVLSLEDIMTVRLKQIQNERTRAEFCWTCTPLVIEYVLLQCREKICTYIDADIYFFSDPVEIIQEIIDNNCSVGLVEHRFERNSEYGMQVFNNGKYCIQFNTFLNDKEGLCVLQDWKENCLDWCYYRYENGKLGDQKYPDKWKQKYSGIHESQNLGAGIAPWNLHLYPYLGKKDKEIWMSYRRRNFRLLFFHFEGIKYLDNGCVYLNIWEPSAIGMRKKIKMLYSEYFKLIGVVRRFLLKKYSVTFEHMFVDRKPYYGKEYLLRQFCRENGLLDGTNKWIAYWRNNIVAVEKFSS